MNEKHKETKRLNVLLAKLADSSCSRCMDKNDRIQELEKQLAESIPKSEIEKLVKTKSKLMHDNIYLGGCNFQDVETFIIKISDIEELLMSNKYCDCEVGTCSGEFPQNRCVFHCIRDDSSKIKENESREEMLERLSSETWTEPN